jgi:hypothetical protein
MADRSRLRKMTTGLRGGPALEDSSSGVVLKMTSFRSPSVFATAIPGHGCVFRPPVWSIHPGSCALSVCLPRFLASGTPKCRSLFGSGPISATRGRCRSSLGVSRVSLVGCRRRRARKTFTLIVPSRPSAQLLLQAGCCPWRIRLALPPRGCVLLASVARRAPQLDSLPTIPIVGGHDLCFSAAILALCPCLAPLVLLIVVPKTFLLSRARPSERRLKIRSSLSLLASPHHRFLQMFAVWFS